MKRALLACAVVVSAWTSVAGLPASAQTPERSEKPLRVAIPGWENNLTPFTITFASQPTTVDLLNLVYDTLFWSQASRTPEPWLAESAEPSADRKTWNVKLRSGVKWHDGRDFSAEDVKFTFEYFKQHSGVSGRYGHHVADVPTFIRAEVLRPEELRLFFRDPLPSFKTLPGADLPILPKHLWQTRDKPLEAKTETSIGTGPFKVAEMTSPQRYRLVANPDYFKGKPLVDEMELSVVGDPNVAFNDLVNDKLDFVSETVPPIFVNQLTENDQLRVVRASRWESLGLNFNALKQPLSDPKLRKAIALSIDNQALVQTVIGGRGRPGVDSFIHPESQWAAPNPGHEFNVGKANQILDSAGYSRKDSDGIRRGPGGERLEFSAMFSTLEPYSLHALRLISQMTTAIGVRMEPEPAAPARLRAVRRTPPGTVPEYDAYVSELEVHAHSDPDAFMFFYHSPPRGLGAQITGYSNPAFDRLIETAASTINITERKQKLAEAQAIFAEEVPSLALFYPDGVYAFRRGAYDGWKADPGHGILTKRSLLEGYANMGRLGDAENSIPPAWIFLGGVAALILVGSGVVLLARRRPGTSIQDPPLPQEDEEPAESTVNSDAGIGDDPGEEGEGEPVPEKPAESTVNSDAGIGDDPGEEGEGEPVPEKPAEVVAQGAAPLSIPPLSGPPERTGWPEIPETWKDGPASGSSAFRPPDLPPLPAPQDLSQVSIPPVLPPLSGPPMLPSDVPGPGTEGGPEVGEVEDEQSQGNDDGETDPASAGS